jgi:threonine aldolase
VVELIRPRGIVLDTDGPRRFRLVTHFWITAEDVDKTVGAFREVLSA